MGYFTPGQVEIFFNRLADGEIKPDHLVDAEFGKQTLLHMVLNSDLTYRLKLRYIKLFIEMGVDVDTYSSGHSTPISMAAQGVANGPTNIEIVKFMLQSHQKGHRSDLDILKAASGSLDKGMFEEILKTGKVDTNVTQMRGSHILHHLADVEGYDDLIKILFEIVPATEPNPIHRKGTSPLTIAINGGMEKNALQLALAGGKIIGNLKDPEAVVDWGMVEDYDGNFFDDFPDMIQYAANNGHEDQLPKTITDLFLF